MKFSDETVNRVANVVLGRRHPGIEHTPPVINESKLHTRQVLEELQPEDLLDEYKMYVPVGQPAIIPMLLWCPECGERHVDRGEFETKIHTTHACQSCGHVWKPAKVATVGVQFLPGYKDPQ